MADWQTHGTKTVYRNKWFRVREDDVTNPAGTNTVYGVVELANDVVYVAAVDDRSRFTLVRQHRYPISRDSWELVAGQCDGEDTKTAAARELHEETALEARDFMPIGNIQTDTGFCNAPITIVLARELTQTEDELDPTDGILEVKQFSTDEIRGMIMSGEIVCPHTIASFYIATNYLEKEKTNG